VPWRNWRATVDENGHYSFAVPLRCRDQPRAPIGQYATSCDFVLRLMVRLSSDFAGWSGYPSIAGLSINPGIDVKCHLQTFAPCRENAAGGWALRFVRLTIIKQSASP
jgi:hypothetical protein